MHKHFVVSWASIAMLNSMPHVEQLLRHSVARLHYEYLLMESFRLVCKIYILKELSSG